MNESLVVSPATSNKAGDMFRVQVDSIRSLCSDDYSPEQIEAWIKSVDASEYRDAIEEGKQSVYMATLGGELIGFSTIDGNDLQAIYVHPDHIKRGVGSLLLYSAEYRVRVRKLRRVTALSSITARPFFEHHGYKVTKETPYTLVNGVQLDFFKMERPLSK